MDYAIAVLDIGKTNKKLVIFDESLNQIDSIYSSFPTIKFNELDVEDINGIDSWFLEGLKKMGSKYPIKVISVTTHGATGVCIDKNGKPSVPVVAYTNEVDEAFHDEFYNVVGAKDELQVKTATAEVKPLINFAKLLYFLKKQFPIDFEKTESILLYPQYFSYMLTGKISADFTYAGCHSYLWDFKEWRWSDVADKLGILSKLPANVNRPGDILGKISNVIVKKTGLNPDTIVTTGIHDSNSSLLPYLINGEEKFILNSTGTWCVVMHPTKELSFTKEELGKMVFYNISANRDLVKTAIFMGGLEFETYTDILKKLHNRYDYPELDIKTTEQILFDRKNFILPGVVKGAGQFPDSEPRIFENNRVYHLSELQNEDHFPEFFNNYEKAYHILVLSLVIQTKVAIERVNAPSNSPIYIEGGFRHNKSYIKLIASIFPNNPVYITNVSEATSFGAALLGKGAYEGKENMELKEFVNIDSRRIESVKIDGFKGYFDTFLNRL
ncbi:MAG: FGGY family carbohydrate kinase [Spirochaetia bacterium]|jgi:L-fuculokinase|nr:FGGY family carbohydrate kinase [Spirochaetia bacterium]